MPAAGGQPRRNLVFDDRISQRRNGILDAERGIRTTKRSKNSAAGHQRQSAFGTEVPNYIATHVLVEPGFAASAQFLNVLATISKQRRNWLLVLQQ